MTGRRRLPPPTPEHGKPYSRLEPLVDELLAQGSKLARDGQGSSSFGPAPQGYIAVLTRRIDWTHLQDCFEMPPDIIYDEVEDVIHDMPCWTAVYGSSGRLVRVADRRATRPSIRNLVHYVRRLRS